VQRRLLIITVHCIYTELHTSLGRAYDDTNSSIALNVEFNLMSVVALRDEEYVQQPVNGYSDNRDCRTAGCPGYVAYC
jgi:hypothetical protein